MSVTCESCGRDTDQKDLVTVRRAYFFDAEDLDPQIADDEEKWCESCAATYPHVRQTD